jgi:hypothetical protein
MKVERKLTRREQQDLMDRTILAFLAKSTRGIRWTALEKRTLGTCHRFATSHRFRSRMRYLLTKNFVERIRIGVYKITEAGCRYLESLNLAYETSKN